MNAITDLLTWLLGGALVVATMLAGYFRASARQAQQDVVVLTGAVQSANDSMERMIAVEKARARAREVGRQELDKMYDILGRGGPRTELERRADE